MNTRTFVALGLGAVLVLGLWRVVVSAAARGRTSQPAGSQQAIRMVCTAANLDERFSPVGDQGLLRVRNDETLGHAPSAGLTDALRTVLPPASFSSSLTWGSSK